MQTDFLKQLAKQGLSIRSDQLDTLSQEEKERTLASLQEIASLYQKEQKEDFSTILPFCDVAIRKDFNESSLLQKGEVGFVFLAGGQSTRFQNLGQNLTKNLNQNLQWKGTYPVYEGKSIIQILLEKLRIIEQKHTMPFAFLVSNETRLLVEKHLKEMGVSCEIVLQNSWPVLTKDKELYMQNGMPYFAPSGNGGTPLHLARYGVLENWQREGVKYIAFVLIDNPLIDLIDPSFWHEVENTAPEIALKAIARKPFETVGALCLKNNRIELLETAWFAKALGENFDESKRSFPWGNSGFMVFSMEFLMQNLQQKLPVHLVQKADANLGTHYRFEQFLTDYLAFSKKTFCYGIDRDEEFAPLKKVGDLALIQKKLKEKQPASS